MVTRASPSRFDPVAMNPLNKPDSVTDKKIATDVVIDNDRTNINVNETFRVRKISCPRISLKYSLEIQI